MSNPDRKELTQAENEKPIKIIDRNHKKIPIERLLELRGKGLSLREIGKIVNCHPSNVSSRLKDYDEYIDFKSNTDKHYEYLLKRIKDSIDLDCIKKAGLYHRVLSMGIIHDKIMQLRGKSQQSMSIKAAILDLERNRKIALEVKVGDAPVADIPANNVTS